MAYEEGLKLEDSPALRKGLQEVKDAKGTFPPLKQTSQILDVLLQRERMLVEASDLRISSLTQMSSENSPPTRAHRSILRTLRSCRNSS